MCRVSCVFDQRMSVSGFDQRMSVECVVCLSCSGRAAGVCRKIGCTVVDEIRAGSGLGTAYSGHENVTLSE